MECAMPPKRKEDIQEDEPAKKTKTEQDNEKMEGGDSSIKIEESKSEMLPHNLKIISWNVNGIRAAIKNGVMAYLRSEPCDILCFQETKCNDKTIPEVLRKWDEYPHKYYCHSKQDGYCGVAVFSKRKPNAVHYGIGSPEYDDEGRFITAHFDQFVLVNAYVPNSGQGLKRLDYRMEFDRQFREYLKKLDEEKPVILCGDLNVSHKVIDLEYPGLNAKTAGFTRQERANFTKLLEENKFLDSFRVLYPDKPKCYTFWSYRMNCRTKDIGWRLDYFVISERLKANLVDVQIKKEILGSDHCPIVLFMDLPTPKAT